MRGSHAPPQACCLTKYAAKSSMVFPATRFYQRLLATWKWTMSACASLLHLRGWTRTLITASTNLSPRRSCRPTVARTKFRYCLPAARKPCLALALPTSKPGSLRAPYLLPRRPTTDAIDEGNPTRCCGGRTPSLALRVPSAARRPAQPAQHRRVGAAYGKCSVTLAPREPSAFWGVSVQSNALALKALVAVSPLMVTECRRTSVKP